MKKIKFFTILILQLFGSNLIAQTATPPASGDGTGGNPYQIATLDNLYWLTQNETEWGKAFIQTTDIDASSTNTWDGGAGYTSIGYAVSLGPSVSFTGSYNGDGNVINALYINRQDAYQGLFGIANGATIENLGLTNVDITILGESSSLLGTCYSTTVNNCYSSGSVTGPNNFIGGLIGNTSNCIVSNCYSAVIVNGADAIGGLIGGGSSTISNCYSTGSVSGNRYVGGLGGNIGSSSINNSYSTGLVTDGNGGGDSGGLTGWSTGTVTNSFWDTQTSGQATSPTGTGKTTTEMKDISTFTNASWDFINETINGNNDYWVMPCGGGYYPKLSWQNVNANGISDLTTTLNGVTITANNVNATYVWLDCDNGNAIISETGQSYIPTSNGNYAVELTENGCVDTTNCVAITTVGILENSFGNNLLVYPNPTNGNFTLDLRTVHKNSNISITDISGKLIESKSIAQSQIINLSLEEPAGIYIISIQTEEQKAVIRLIKE